MISPKLYKSSKTYDFFLKLLGYESSIDRFLASQQFDLKDDCRILDAGCGTGFVGLHFLQRFPQSTLFSTDIEPNFLRAMLDNANRRGIEQRRITAGRADISAPREITLLDDTTRSLADEMFDLICIGAVVGYAGDTEHSLRELARLLAPGGYLLNLEMNESPTGRFVSHRYHYENISIRQICECLQQQGLSVKQRKFSLRHLPAKFTRTAIIAQKARPSG